MTKITDLILEMNEALIEKDGDRAVRACDTLEELLICPGEKQAYRELFATIVEQIDAS